MRFHIVTLGCPKNVVDSEGIQKQLLEHGLLPTAKPEHADVLIVNTCGFIELAREESLQTLRTLAKRKRAGQRLIAAGCMAERYAAEITAKVPKVDAIVGTRHLAEIGHFVGNGASAVGPRPVTRTVAPTRHTAYLKIADGCSAPCAFCVIPQIKGPYQSKPPAEILSEARALAREGVKEIVLIAQDTTAYGYDWGERDALAGLLERLVESVPEVAWWRLMYAYPGRISERLIRVMAEHPSICHYLDLPLQHAHPEVLKRMRRPSDGRTTRHLIADLRRAMPDIALRTTFIAGFPGETDEQFQTLLAFMREVEFDRVGVFTYSREEDTPAATLDGQLSEEVKQSRFEQAMLLQQEISARKQRSLIGQDLAVLVEGEGEAVASIARSRRGKRRSAERVLVGRSYRDAPEVDGLVLCSGPGRPGDLLTVKVGEALAYDLVGEVVGDSAAAIGELRASGQ